MLTTIGRGVILDAIVKLGLVNTQDDYAVTRFVKKDNAGHELDVDVVWSIVANDLAVDYEASETASKVPLSPLMPILPPMVAELAVILNSLGCKILYPAGDLESDSFAGRLRFIRIDKLQRVGRPLVTAVQVHASYRRCIGPTSI